LCATCAASRVLSYYFGLRSRSGQTLRPYGGLVVPSPRLFLYPENIKGNGVAPGPAAPAGMAQEWRCSPRPFIASLFTPEAPPARSYPN